MPLPRGGVGSTGWAPEGFRVFAEMLNRESGLDDAGDDVSECPLPLDGLDLGALAVAADGRRRERVVDAG